jgi:hypothetical protein
LVVTSNYDAKSYLFPIYIIHNTYDNRYVMNYINFIARKHVIESESREQGGIEMKKTRKLMGILHDHSDVRNLFTGIILCGMGLVSMLVTMTVWYF